jgi:hypothetical protein
MTSSGRIAGLAKYLAALSPVLTDSTTPTGKRYSSRRKRLNVLYLINDLLHHTKCHKTDGDVFTEGVKGVLNSLFTAAIYPQAVKQLARLDRLLQIWTSKQYYPEDFLDELKAEIKKVAAAIPTSTSADGGEAESGGSDIQTKEKTLLLPPFHGDPSIPFYDLPAGNLLPHITPNSITPINPRQVRPVQFSSITPDRALVTAVHDFHDSVDSMFGGKDTNDEPDAVGGFGTAEDGEGYYGWSRAFCERMRQKKRVAADKDRKKPLRHTSSSSSSRRRNGRGETSRGKRGSYTSDDYSRSPSSARSRSTSRSRSRSRSRTTRSRHRHRRRHRQSSSAPDSPPKSRRRMNRSSSRSQSPPRSRSGSYRGMRLERATPTQAPQPPSPAPPTQQAPLQNNQPQHHAQQSPQQQEQQWGHSQHQIQYGFQHQFSPMPQGWMPPPPPLPNAGFQVQQGFPYFPQMQGMLGIQAMQGISGMQMGYGQWQQQSQQQQQQQHGYSQQSYAAQGMGMDSNSNHNILHHHHHPLPLLLDHILDRKMGVVGGFEHS